MNQFSSPKSFGLQWHITERCNWHCAHCYQDEKLASELSLDQLFYVFDQFLALIKKWQTLPRETVLNITGGEPLVRDDLFRLLERVARYSQMYRWGILTNGSLLTKDNLKKLKEYNIARLQVSLDGMEKKNDEIRGAGAFQKTVEAIRLIREAGFNPSVSFTLTKSNIGDVVPLANLLADMGVEILGTRRMIPWGKGKELAGALLQPGELRDYYLRVKEMNRSLASRKKRLRIVIGCEGAIFSEDILAGSPSGMETFYCGVTRGGQLNIMANGDIMPCRRFPVIMGNVLKDDLEDVYFSEPMQELRNLEKLHPFCKQCRNFFDCLGGARCVTYAFAKRWDIPDVQCWQAYQKLGDAPPVAAEKTRPKNYALNEYFPFPLDEENTVLTTRHRGWAIVNKNDYDKIKKNQLEENPELFKNLESVGIVLTKRSVSNVAFLLRQQHRFLSRHPSYHVIAVTNRCNLDCLYCLFKHKQKSRVQDMDEGTAEKVLDFIFSLPQDYYTILIEGGETLLKWDLIKKIYAGARKRAKSKNAVLNFAIGTNTNLMTDEIAEELRQTGISPCISLDGPKKIHDIHRISLSGGGSYDKAVYWIKKLRKTGVRLNILPVITKLSLQIGPKPIVDEYIKLKQHTIFLKPLRVTGDIASNVEKLIMNPEEFFNFWQEGIEYCLYLNKRGIEISESNASYLISNLLFPHFAGRKSSMCFRRPCGAGFSILSYTPDGTITACDTARELGILDLGNVAEDDYPTVRTRAIPLLRLVPDATPICNTCPLMSYCGVCPVINWENEKDLAPKPYRNFECQWQKMAMRYLFQKFLKGGEDVEILNSWRE